MATETRVSGANVTAALAELVASVRYEQLPDAARTAGRRMLLDTLAVSIAGTVDPGYAPARAFAARAFGKGDIPVAGERPTDVLGAAFLGGVAAHLLDYDDIHPMMGGHPSAVLFPVVFSLGYELGISGQEAIRAMVIGGEVEARIGNAMNPAHYSVGWHPTSVIGTLGAAASAAALLNLDEDATRRALGIAASLAGGTKANFGSSVKSMHIGVAARSGIEAALFAASGATANDHILDEQFGGFCELYSPETDRTRMLGDLGDVWYVADPGVAFKSLPCCGSTHASVWGMIEIWRQHKPDPNQIREIRSGVDYRRMPHTNRPVVNSGLEGKFSTQYCVSVAALQGAVGLNDFDDEVVGEPARQELMGKVNYYASPDADTWPDPAKRTTGSAGALVEVEMEDGETFRHLQTDGNPFRAVAPDDSDLEPKFLDCVGRVLSEDQTRAMFEQVTQLESVSDIRPLVEQSWQQK